MKNYFYLSGFFFTTYLIVGTILFSTQLLGPSTVKILTNVLIIMVIAHTNASTPWDHLTVPVPEAMY